MFGRSVPCLRTALCLAAGSLLFWPPPARASNLLAQLETEVQKLAADLSASVVTVRAVHVQDDRGEMREVYVGTGIVFDSGWIVTTPSVVGSQVSYSVQSPGQVPVPAELAGYDPEGHVAVFRAPRLAAPAARFAATSSLVPGQFLLVVGNAYGLESSVAWGVAAGHRDDGLWQIGVNVAPGAPGSPVVNTSGTVVGMVAAALSAAAEPDPSVFGGNVAVVVPADRSILLARQIAREGAVGRSFLGVRPEPVDEGLANALGLSHGILIGAVSFGSPAYAAGLRAGDVLIELDRRPIAHEQVLRQILSEHCPGEEIELVIVRDRQVSRRDVRLGQRPDLLPSRPAAARMRMPVPAGTPEDDETGPALDRQATEEQIRRLQQRLEQLKEEPNTP